MSRIILIDDSASARALLGLRLREEGYEVEDAPDAVKGAELALSHPPDAVVTDLWMPGMSGVQLCRLLRAEPATTHVPVILLTASEDRRSRFWARSAGAVAYVTKTEVSELLGTLAKAVTTARARAQALGNTPPVPPSAARGSVQERLSQLLDTALFESTLAGEVRSLGQNDADLERVFSELTSLVSDVALYRWLALWTADDSRLLLHAHPSSWPNVEAEAKRAFGILPLEERRSAVIVTHASGSSSSASGAPASSGPASGASLSSGSLGGALGASVSAVLSMGSSSGMPAVTVSAAAPALTGPSGTAASPSMAMPAPPQDDDLFRVEDTRALEGDATSAPIVQPIRFGAQITGKLALGPGKRGASSDDRKLVSLVAHELGGPLRIVMLVAQARRLAATDALTGLMNRRAFLEALERERSRASRHLYPMSLLLLDVDHFKKVNDTRGHEAGDAVLQGVARVLRTIARKSDILARWGGEEFVVALPQTADTGARIAAERIRRALAEAVYNLPDGDALTVTASVGLASGTSSDGFDAEDLISRADRAMYAAKARGRNRVEIG